MHGKEKVDKEKLFCLSRNTRTWGHPMNLNAGRFGTGRNKVLLHTMHTKTVGFIQNLPSL